MESKVPRSAKSKASRRRTKSSTTGQTLLKQKGITTRSMQRKATYRTVDMKENCSSGTEMISQEFSVPSGSSYMTKLQHQYTDLACKENILEQQTESLGGLLHANVGPLLRPKLQQQQVFPPPTATSYSHQQSCGVAEVEQCLVEYGSTQGSSGNINHVTPQTECGSKLSQLNLEVNHYQGRALMPTSTQSLSVLSIQQQQSCKLRISSLMGSCDSSESNHMLRSPLPNLHWVHADELWQVMRSKDTSRVAPEAELRVRHPGILSSMRVILLDWMMEVCEEYRLHRETYYLAMDMFDRFLDSRTGVRKEQLQLLGVTCLFIASKIEEIYPPKAAEFAYVTDGACSVEDLLDTELIICKVLNWRLNHNMVTPSTWVNTYMQLGSHHLRPAGIKVKDFDFPAYSSTEFSRVMKLLDLSSLDVASRQFGSSVLAASAVYLQSERYRANLSVITGFEFKDIHMCVEWMQPCAITLSQKPLVSQKKFAGVIPQDTHNIQTHDISIPMLEDSVELRKSQGASTSQYMLLQDCSILMTPPRNERRYLAPINTSC